MSELSTTSPSTQSPPVILHVCKREMLRPLRDQILRLSGFQVQSTLDRREAIEMFRTHSYDLTLIDVEGERGVLDAEELCSAIKTLDKNHLVAFVCNWRVAALTDCPDDVIRAEFDPAAFVAGVKQIMQKH